MIIHGVSTFDGTLLNNRFAHRFLGDMSLPIGNCVSFVSDSTFEILEGEGIYHFCYEIPNVNQFGLVTFHKLLLICIANELSRSLWKYELHDSYSITVENETLCAHKNGKKLKELNKNYLNIKNGIGIGYVGIDFVDIGFNIDVEGKLIENAFYMLMERISVNSMKI